MYLRSKAAVISFSSVYLLIPYTYFINIYCFSLKHLSITFVLSINISSEVEKIIAGTHPTPPPPFIIYLFIILNKKYFLIIHNVCIVSQSINQYLNKSVQYKLAQVKLQYQTGPQGDAKDHGIACL